MSTEFKLYIQMDENTINHLGGQNLYFLRAVKTNVSTSDPPPRPAIWLSLANRYIAKQTLFKWIENYALYCSASTVPGPGQQIESINDYPSEKLGATLDIIRPNATGTLEQGIPNGSFQFNNKVNGSQFSCGLCTREKDGEDEIIKPYNSFGILGTNSILLTPVTKILAFFSTETIDHGTVISRTTSQGAFIDFTSAVKGQRIVHYMAGTGWTDQPWIELIESGVNVADKLIIPGG